MKLSSLFRALSSIEELKDFVHSLTKEISAYAILSKKRGASVPILLSEDCSGQVGINQINVLIDAYLSGVLNDDEFSYILDALSLAQKVSFSSLEIRNLVLDMADEPSDKKAILGFRLKLNARK